MLRIGLGYDSHRFAPGRKLKIGGIEIEYKYGLLGHSDGDVMLHAISDALLGAGGLGDIGIYFPDTDPKYEGIDSKDILSKVVEKINDSGYEVINIDCVLISEEPKFQPYYEKIKKSISHLLGIKESQINIKAKSNEKMGFIGRKEGIVCYAIALLKARI